MRYCRLRGWRYFKGGVYRDYPENAIGQQVASQEQKIRRPQTSDQDQPGVVLSRNSSEHGQIKLPDTKVVGRTKQLGFSSRQSAADLRPAPVASRRLSARRGQRLATRLDADRSSAGSTRLDRGLRTGPAPWSEPDAPGWRGSHPGALPSRFASPGACLKAKAGLASAPRRTKIEYRMSDHASLSRSTVRPVLARRLGVPSPPMSARLVIELQRIVTRDLSVRAFGP